MSSPLDWNIDEFEVLDKGEGGTLTLYHAPSGETETLDSMSADLVRETARLEGLSPVEWLVYHACTEMLFDRALAGLNAETKPKP